MPATAAITMTPLSGGDMQPKLPAEWWKSDIYDRLLLTCIYTHGYGKYDLIKNDKSIPVFYERRDQFPAASLLNKRLKRYV